MDIDQFMAAISGKESGGNYNSVNKDSGASGRFQIMPGNWAGWSREAGLPANAPMTPQNQDLVARHKMMEYYNAYGGNWGAVAAAWYGGPGAAQRYLKNPNDPYLTRGQGGGKYPSIDAYVNSVLGGKGAAGHGGGLPGAGQPATSAPAGHQSPVAARSAPATPNFLPGASALQTPSLGLFNATTNYAAQQPGAAPDQAPRPDLASQLHGPGIGNQAPDWAMNWNKTGNI